MKSKIKHQLTNILFSAILIAPIVVVLVLAVINQPRNSFDSYSAVFDFSGIETDVVETGDITESLIIAGKADSNEIIEMRINYGVSNTFVPTCEQGEYVDTNKVIGILNGKPVRSNKNGIIIASREIEGGMLYLLKSPKVDSIFLDVPVESYPYISKSYITLKHLNKERVYKYYRSDGATSDNGNTIKAYYAVVDNDFVLGADTDVRLFTGNSKKDALIVSDKCIFNNENGGYYVERLENGEKVSLNIMLGIVGDGVVEIIPADDFAKDQIYSGMEVVINSKSIDHSTRNETGGSESQNDKT